MTVPVSEVFCVWRISGAVAAVFTHMWLFLFHYNNTKKHSITVRPTMAKILLVNAFE